MSEVHDNKLKNMSKREQELWAMRHSTEHVLTQAMLSLYPDLKMAMGPATNEGFYFDFDFDGKISEDSFPAIEAEMKKIIKKDLAFKKKIISVSEAKKLFKGNRYKQEWLDEIEERKEKASVYWTADEFVDLCAGPHVASTGDIGPFKLLSVAGAYWRGSEKNKMLTRIYGTTFPTQKELNKHISDRKEAIKRNHRKIGKEMELFAVFDEIGQGLPVWLPKGYAMRRALEDYMITLERKYGYEHILTPHIHKKELFETSGHLGFYDESMYSPMEIDDEKYYLKPMNCPAGMVVFRSKPRSYRDLPVKMGEFGTVYRYEKSGELHGLQRVRGFTQNDAHIYCTKEQLEEQVEEVMEMLKIFYKDLGFKNYKFMLATSDPDEKKFQEYGTRKGWKMAEDILRKVLEKNKVEFREDKGEAAFYGPKIDVLAVNVFGKEDAISTIQIDFNLPEKFKLSYINSKGEKEEPFVIHRALIGSFERFFAFLIEYYAGAFPVWLAPVQVKILPLTDRNLKYAKMVADKLRDENIRVEIDGRNETLPAKIRNAQLEKAPYMLIVGDKEEKSKKVSLRLRSEKDLGAISLKTFIERVNNNIKEKSLKL
jgi:threonyl-tRNA synthetase